MVPASKLPSLAHRQEALGIFAKRSSGCRGVLCKVPLARTEPYRAACRSPSHQVDLDGFRLGAKAIPVPANKPTERKVARASAGSLFSGLANHPFERLPFQSAQPRKQRSLDFPERGEACIATRRADRVKPREQELIGNGIASNSRIVFRKYRKLSLYQPQISHQGGKVRAERFEIRQCCAQLSVSARAAACDFPQNGTVVSACDKTP